jgi:two-component system, NarL family, sensor kinase
LKTARTQSAIRPVPSRPTGRSDSRPAVTSGGARAGRANAGELAELRARLTETEETLRAIRAGEVDAVVVAGRQGLRVFTLEGAEHAYRVLIESMNEGALTLSADAVILYANQCFAKMVRHPLERVTGSSFRRFLTAADQVTFQPLLKRAVKSGSKIQVQLKAGDGSLMPVQISICPLPKSGFDRRTIGIVVTDMTEARRNEGMLRALSHRVVQAQEAERGRVAVELHDHITQHLCGILLRSQALAAALSAQDGLAKREAAKLSEMLGATAEEVERISRNLRPSVLDQLGLVAALRQTSMEFADRTGVSVKLGLAQLTARLPAETELALYRILQETLENVAKHARAVHVTVCLRQQSAFVQLVINDDGIGFDPEPGQAKRIGKERLGLLSMRERAAYVGGAVKVTSLRRAGTKIEVRIPLPSSSTAANGTE